MKYQVLELFKVKTSQGERELQPGQIITLPKDTAIRLLNESKITPIERVAYKVYSEILQGYLWVVDTDEDMHSLRSQGIYTSDEIRKLKGVGKEHLKAVHEVKTVFENSKIEKITTKENHEC